ncbi:MAG: DEAD/DEAH box helicase [Oceanospirillales bacterium]|nr:DEAD/DEAH box helicase [Oceanospirillales bacterium]
MSLFTVDDIEYMADHATFKRGWAYFSDARVEQVGRPDGSSTIEARVRGSGHHLYSTRLHVDNGRLGGVCSCPVGRNCKHAVATALQWLSVVDEPKASSAEALTPWQAWWADMPQSENAVPQQPQPGRMHLLYCLHVDAAGGVVLSLRKGYLKQNGSWSRVTAYAPEFFSMFYNPPEFMTTYDIKVLRSLQGVERDYRGFVLEGELGGRLLARLALTGRLAHESESNRLALGPERMLDWAWQQAEGQHQLLPLLDGTPGGPLLDVIPLHYLDVEQGLIGLLRSSVAASRAVHLAAMPALSTAEMTLASLQLRQLFEPAQLPLPDEPEVQEANTPVPCLRVVASENEQGVRFPGIQVNFAYAGYQVEPDYYAELGTGLVQLHEHEGQCWQIIRDQVAETAALERLRAFGFDLRPRHGGWQHLWIPHRESASASLMLWQHFLDEHLPVLQADGWQVTMDPNYVFRVHDSRFQIVIKDAPDNWFDFALQLPMGDQRLSTQDVVAAWLEEGMPQELALPVSDGWVRIDAQPLAALHGLIMELYQQGQLEQPTRLPAFQAAQLAPQLSGHEALDDRQAPLTCQLIEQLQDFNGLQSVPVPKGLRAQLRSYQQQGLEWLHFLHRYGFGGILADDMGLGKTLQTLALIQSLKEQGQLTQPAMVLAPTSLMGNWLREARQFTPELRVCLLHGTDRMQHVDTIGTSDLVVTSYPLLLRDIAHYQTQSFSLLVLDEAQAIKNPKTKISRQVRQLRSGMRLCLTGTPLENHLGELWALMDFALPGLLSEQTLFNQIYRHPIEQASDSDSQQALARKVAPFMLRRTKTAVVAELPPKSEIIQYVELDGRQRELYEAIRVSMEQRVRDLIASKGLARSRIEFLDALLKLRQACIDPRLVKLEQAQGIQQGAKLEWLADNLSAMLEEGRRILIFSQFTQVLGLVEEQLKAQGVGYSKLTGQTRKRQEAVDRFQRGDVPVFLISLKAGGSGLNLTTADTVIHLDPWWNPAVEQQATDRAYRIGQDKPVFVYKLVATNTVEERIQHMQQQKQALADALFDATGRAGMPTGVDQLLELLA